jgi:hypothetical protein
MGSALDGLLVARCMSHVAVQVVCPETVGELYRCHQSIEHGTYSGWASRAARPSPAWATDRTDGRSSMIRHWKLIVGMVGVLALAGLGTGLAIGLSGATVSPAAGSAQCQGL